MREQRFRSRSRRSIRLPGYDYGQAGVYFVTICAFQQATLFGEITDGAMALNELGKIVSAEWQHVSTVRRNVKLDQFVVMPNHIHGLVIIESCINGDNSRNTTGNRTMRAGTLQSGSLGAIVGQFKLAVNRQARRLNLYPAHRIWQRNYHEHIVRDETSLNEIRRYILENPARWNDDGLYVE